MRLRFEGLFASPLREGQRAGTVGAGLSPADVRLLVLMVSSLADQKGRPADRARAIELAEAVLRSDA